MKQLETLLDTWLVKKAPIQVPENGRNIAVQYFPWLAMVGAVCASIAAFGLLIVMTLASGFLNHINDAAVSRGLVTPLAATLLWPLLWLNVALFVAEAVLLFRAFTPLRAAQKQGWTMLFWVVLLNVGYQLIDVAVGLDILSFIASLASLIIVLYLLFQVRAHYTSAAKVVQSKK